MERQTINHTEKKNRRRVCFSLRACTSGAKDSELDLNLVNHGLETIMEHALPRFKRFSKAAGRCSPRLPPQRPLAFKRAAVFPPPLRFEPQQCALLRQLFTRFFVTAPVTGDWVRGDWVRRGGYRVSSGT